MRKVICLVADLHTGATTGLTPDPNNEIQEILLDKWKESIAWFGERPDYLILNGDGYDGLDPKGGDVDDRNILSQAEKCARLLTMWEIKERAYILRGSAYHTKITDQEFEEHIQKSLQLDILSKTNRLIEVKCLPELDFYINDWFHLYARHFIGSSMVFHTQGMAPVRNMTSKALEYIQQLVLGGELPNIPPAHLHVFAHRHQYYRADTDLGEVLVLPCFQAKGGEYGTKLCEPKPLTIGIAKLVVEEKGKWELDTRCRWSAKVIDSFLEIG